MSKEITASMFDTTVENERDFNFIVEEEKELAEVIEEIVSRCIRTTFTKRKWGTDGLPEDFECFLQINSDGVSLISCG
jgi:Txe/YoeB family toxin of Txe-Axe toxin-antitoxin module